MSNIFSPQAVLATGRQVREITVVDLTGDGSPDLACVNYIDSTVSVLLGNGNGTFQGQRVFGVGTHPAGLAAADFNEDGKPDLAVVNSGTNNVGIYTGDGAGNFTSVGNVAVGTFPYKVATTKLSGVHSDLIVGNLTSNTLSVLLGNGNGTFKAQVTYAAGTSPLSITAADLNGDGKPDIIVANNGSSNLTVFLGNGNGTLTAGTNYTTVATPGQVAVGDLNGDGRFDLVVCSTGGTSVSVLLGNGNGTFQAQTTFTAVESAEIVLVDADGDGKLDLVLTDDTNNLLCVYQGNGDGTFKTSAGWPQTYACLTAPVSMATADFNGDTRPDIVVGVGGSNSNIGLFLNASPNVPATPTGLTATALSAVQVQLQWTQPDLPAIQPTGYLIYKDEDAGFAHGYTPYNVLAGNPVLVDSGLEPETTYYYQVIAYNGFGNSTPSNEASAITLLPSATNTVFLNNGVFYQKFTSQVANQGGPVLSLT